jgi:two-component system NarL family sensor kinase
MNKTFERFFYFCLIFIIHSNLVAKPITREEIEEKSISSLVMLQELDSVNVKKYVKVNNLFLNEDYSKSLKHTLVLLNKIKNKNRELEYLCNFLIGEIFRKRNNHEKALEYFKESLRLAEKKEVLIDSKLKFYDISLNNGESLANSLLRVGTEFYMLSNKDSAKTYFKRILKLTSLSDFSKVKASAYSNLTGIYQGEKEYDLAKSYAIKAINLYKNNNNKLLESSALNNYANIFLLEKNYTKAKKVYSEAIDIIKNDESIKAIKNKEDLYYNLAYVLYMQKDYKAYEYLDQSYIFKDTLNDREIKRIVKGVYVEYQEQYKVELVKNQVALKKAEEQRTAWFFGILSFLVIISSGFIVYNYKLRQNNLKLKLDQTKLAQKSRLERLRSESQVRILNATLDGKETERKQIAETLHDSVSSLLSSANLHLQATKMQFNGDTPIEIDKTQKIILEASQTIRDLSHALVSAVLLKFGLKYAIKDMAEKYSNSQIQINTDIKNLRRYHQSFEIKVNNIIQEFVNNILKHSNASKAIVRVEDKNGKLIISIQDNGCGFDKNKIPEKDGLGINQIDARIQMMKGVFNIDSNARNGTKIDVILPILEKEGVIHV